MTAHREVEIRVRIPDNGGVTDALALLVNHQLPTLTRSCFTDRTGLMLLLTASRPEEVQQVLEEAGYVCQTHAVVLLGPTTYRPGVAAQLLGDLGRKGVNIRYSYLSSVTTESCYVVVETSDDDRVLKEVAGAA